MTWYSKEKDEEAWLPREKAKSPSKEAMQDYAQLYVYGSHLQPGLERTPEYLTPREREAVSQETVRQRYEESLEERSGILARKEERNIIAEQLLEQRRPFYEHLTRGVGLLSEAGTRLYDVQLRLGGIEESLTILKYKQKGYTLIGRTETELIFGIPEPPKGIAETLLQFETKPLISYLGLKPLPRTPLEFVKPKETVKPFAGIAGLVAPFEATVYTGGRLLGFKTPDIPPTFISFEPQRAMEYGPEYAAGTVLGDVLLSLAIGKGVSKVWQHTPRFIQKPVEKLGAKIFKPFEPLTRRIEKGILWPHEKLAYGEIALTSALPSASEPLSFKKLLAEELAWEIHQAPRMGGVWIGKTTIETTTAAPMKHLFVRGGVISIGYLQELAFERQLLPFTTQQQLTRMGIYPYIPKVSALGISKVSIAPLIGLGVVGISTVVSKPKRKGTITPISVSLAPKLTVWEEPYPLQRLKMFPSLFPKEKEKQASILIPKLTVLTEQRMNVGTVQRTVQKSTQVTKQSPKLALAMPESLLQKQIQVFAPLKIPSFREPSLRGKGKGLFGAWFKRTHQIKTPEQLEEAFYRKRIKWGKAKRKMVW